MPRIGPDLVIPYGPTWVLLRLPCANSGPSETKMSLREAIWQKSFAPWDEIQVSPLRTQKKQAYKTYVSKF